jgi:hypothetical protein
VLERSRNQRWPHLRAQHDRSGRVRRIHRSSAKTKLRLQSALVGPNNSFRLLISTEDGSSIEASRAANIDVFVTTALGGRTRAVKLNQSAVLTNGELQIDALQSDEMPQQFFRTEENP